MNFLLFKHLKTLRIMKTYIFPLLIMIISCCFINSSLQAQFSVTICSGESYPVPEPPLPVDPGPMFEPSGPVGEDGIPPEPIQNHNCSSFSIVGDNEDSWEFTASGGIIVYPTTTTTFTFQNVWQDGSFGCDPGPEWIVEVIVDEGCEGTPIEEEEEIETTDGGTDPVAQTGVDETTGSLTGDVFIDYPFLNNLVDVNDCEGVQISVYEQGSTDFILINTNEGINMYNSDGLFYCADAPGFSCTAAYGLGSTSNVWLCGDDPTEPPTANFNLTVCQGETVQNSFAMLGIPIDGCQGQPQGPLGTVSASPSEGVSFANINNFTADVTFSPTVSTFYTITHDGFLCGNPASVSATYYVEVEEDCNEPGETPEVFNTFPWLSGIVDVNDCAGTQVAVYDQGGYSFVLVNTNEGISMYFEDGSFYCADFPGFSCAAAYGLGSTSDVWVCGDVVEPPEPPTSTVNLTVCLGETVEGIPNLVAQPIDGCGAGPQPPFGTITVEPSNTATVAITDNNIFGVTFSPTVSTTYTVVHNGFNCSTPATATTTFYVEVDEDCTDPGQTPPVFNDFSWLSNIVNPNNCEGTIISVYTEGPFSFVFIETPAGGSLYFEDGSFYCSDASGFSCVSAYGFGAPSTTWTCGTTPPTGLICGVEDPINDLAWMVDYFADAPGTYFIDYYSFNNEDYIAIAPANVADALTFVFTCDGTVFCSAGGIGGTNNCPDFISQANLVEHIDYTVTQPIDDELFIAYPWLTNLFGDACESGDAVTEYDLGPYAFVYVENANGGILYYQDGSLYCTSSSTLDCLSAYGLTNPTASWACGLDRPAPLCTEALTPIVVCHEYGSNYRLEELDLAAEAGSVQQLDETCFRYTPSLTTQGDKEISAMVCTDEGICEMVLFDVKVGNCNAGTDLLTQGENETIVATERRTTDASLILDNVNKMDNGPSTLNVFTMYPNPTTDRAVLQINDSSDTEKTITVYDLKGTAIQQIELTSDSNQSNVTIDLSEMPTGIYMVQLQTPFTSDVQRLIKE